MLTIHLPASASLKDKRQVVRSVLARVRNQFEVAAAEVEHQDTWQLATLGLACVSNDAGHAEEILASVRRFIEESRPDVIITDATVEVLPFGD
jgi:uncharacterized protein YlxP (DUF503 family)